MSSKATLSGFNTGKYLPDELAAQGPDDAKAPQTAWQRWEMASFGQKPAVSAGPEPELKPIEPVPVIDQAELDRLRLEAQMAGDARGYEEGYARGQADGQAAGQLTVQAQAEQLLALAQSLPAALLSAQTRVGDELLALALDIAKQVLGQALAAEPQAILSVVQELLQAEPALSGTPQLVLHPDDAALVKEVMADELKAAGWRLRADAHITRGGCRVLASGGERDATLETRWERVAATLARHAPAMPALPAEAA